ncbi:MAG: hypothetical protein L3J00_08340 [Thiomicrorhabdus sp.]|nr:hypothetical protein [Thiomicrorhabdus sp.]
MAHSKKILLVEGEADKGFFEEMCKILDLNAQVQVALPKELGGTHNTKGGILSHLNILLPQLNDGHLTNIAVIVDADYIKHGSGKQKTFVQVSNILEEFDFTLRDSDSDQKGFLFNHSDGLEDFGLWIMPNNHSEGMLEDWIIECVESDEKVLFDQAVISVQNLSSPKFSAHLQSKAKVATWLAWQKKPGHGLYGAMTEELLDNNSMSYTNLSNWLQKIFNDK